MGCVKIHGKTFILCANMNTFCFVDHLLIFFFFFLISVSRPIRAISEQKVRVKRLGTDLTSAQKEMRAKHKAYENAVGILSRRLQEALTDKETAEAELLKLKAQVSDGGNSQVLQVHRKAMMLTEEGFSVTPVEHIY